MQTIRFNIGEAFPASDPVARFITVVGMVSNDWLRLVNEMVAIDDEDPDGAGRRVMSFRQQAALHHEAAEFIMSARRRFPEIEAFITGLADEAQRECAQVTGGVDPRSPDYLGDWLGDHRNVTFHYPELHPEKAAHGQEEISEALSKAADLEGTITMDEKFGTVRFEFADQVVVQWLPTPTEKEQVAALRESVMALGRFAQRAAQAYLESRPEGTITREP
jgi:hypothetical protein